MKKVNLSKKQRNMSKKKITARSKSAPTSEKKHWRSRKKTFSPYPYVITISNYKSNVFFTAADIKGQTKTWTSTGRSDFKNKDKTTYLAIFRVTELFYKKLWNFGIRCVLFKFKNLYKRKTKFAVRNSMRKIKRTLLFRLKYIGFIAKTQVSFNGCRKKKKKTAHIKILHASPSKKGFRDPIVWIEVTELWCM